MTPLPAAQALDAFFLDTRARLLDVAATLDRLHRGGGTLSGDVRLQRIEKALHVLLEKDGADRAAKIQQIFSLEYDAKWKVPQPR